MRIYSLILMGGLALFLTGRLHAGQIDSLPYKIKPTPQELEEYYAAAAIADTGRMIRPTGDLSFYTFPSQCLGLITRTVNGSWKSGEKLFLKAFIGDSMPTAAREVGLKCLENMTPESVPEMDLYNLLLASSMVRDTAKMKSVIEYYITREHNDTAAQIRFIANAGSMAISHSLPVGYKFVEGLVELSKRYGVRGLAATSNLIGWEVHESYVRFDTIAMRKASDKRSAYLSNFSDDQIQSAGIPWTVKTISQHDSMIIAEYVRSNDWKDQLQHHIDIRWEDWPRFKTERNEYFLVVNRLTGEKPLEFEADVITAYPSVREIQPQSGRVTIYHELKVTDGVIGSMTGLTPDLMVLKRLYDQYHQRGLDIVLVSKSRGRLWASPPLDFEMEAPIHEWFIRDYLKLPFKLVVLKVPTDRLHDGRIVRHTTPWDLWRGGSSSNPGYIVGRDGAVQSLDFVGYGTGNENHISAVIERELAK